MFEHHLGYYNNIIIIIIIIHIFLNPGENANYWYVTCVCTFACVQVAIGELAAWWKSFL